MTINLSIIQFFALLLLAEWEENYDNGNNLDTIALEQGDCQLYTN